MYPLGESEELSRESVAFTSRSMRRFCVLNLDLDSGRDKGSAAVFESENLDGANGVVRPVQIGPDHARSGYFLAKPNTP